MECDIDKDGREIGRRGERVRKRVPKSMQGPLGAEREREREDRFGGEDAKNTPVGS